MSGIIGGAGSKSGVIGKKGDGMILLYKKTHSGSSITFDGVFTPKFIIYKIFINNFYTNVLGAPLYGKFKIGGSDASASAYRHVVRGIKGDSSSFYDTDSVRGYTDTKFRIDPLLIDNTLGHSFDVELTIIDPTNTSTYKRIRYESTNSVPHGASSGAPDAIVASRGGAVYMDSTAALTGMSFETSGNVEGTVLVYGYRN